MDDDGHEVVTLMYDQLDVLEQTLDCPYMLGLTELRSEVSAWIQETRKFLPERGKRG